jgi:predicted porin
VLLQRRTGHLELEAGPQLSVVLTQRTDQTDSGGHHTITTGPAGLRRLQAGYIVGVGYRAAAGLGVGLRYSRSMTSVSYPSGLCASSIQLQASYQFRPAVASQ